MPNLNRVLLMGHLTRDVEVKHIDGTNSVASLGLAINRKFKTKAGEDREEFLFVDCEAWGKTGETMAKYLRKGGAVFIEGRLKLDQWENESGEKRSKIKVVVENFQFVGGKADAEPVGAKAAPLHPAVGDEDIPF